MRFRSVCKICFAERSPLGRLPVFPMGRLSPRRFWTIRSSIQVQRYRLRGECPSALSARLRLGCKIGCQLVRQQILASMMCCQHLVKRSQLSNYSHAGLNGDFNLHALLVADSLGTGGIVLGTSLRDWRGLALAEIGNSLSIADEPVVDKRGGNPVGNPLQAIVLLANHLARRRRMWEPGQIIMTGAFSGVHHAKDGPTDRSSL